MRLKLLKYYFIIFCTISLFNTKFLSQNQNIRLVATMDDLTRLEGGDLTHIWGYNFFTPPTYHASLPAPLLTLTTGDSVNIFFYNDSPEDHTIHLHGLDVAQNMDGVPTTSFSVPYHDSTNYSFKAPHPGTYLYHCHVQTTLHLAMGMYGMIVVNDSIANQLYNNGPTFNKTYPLLASDMYQFWNDNPLSPGPLYQYYADRFLINGKSGIQLFEDTSRVIDAFVGDSIRLNIGNIGYNKVTYVFPEELNPIVYLSDGRKLPQAFKTDSLVVYPGERYTLLCTPGSYYEGYISVYYENLKSNTIDGINLIGINRYNHPNSIDEMKIEKPLIYPNPTNNFIYLTKKGFTTFDLINSDGKLIETGQLYNDSIDLSNIPTGFYLIKLNDGSVFKVFKY